MTSSTWDFDSKEKSSSRGSHSSDRPGSRPSGGWRKKPETETEQSSSSQKVENAGRQQVTQEGSGTDSSSSSEAEDEENKERIVIPAKKVTETDLNEIGAKIVKAEIMGNEVRTVQIYRLRSYSQLAGGIHLSCATYHVPPFS